MAIGPLAIQRILNKHGMGEPAMALATQPAQPKGTGAAQSHTGNTGTAGSAQASHASPASAAEPLSQSADKNEEYYLNHCPLELASICVKSLVDILVQVGRCHSVDDVPAQVSQLLRWCNKKSDQTVE